MSTTTRRMTAEELLARPRDGVRSELIEGELIEMQPAGFSHGVTTNFLGTYLTVFVGENNLGLVTTAETGFKIATNPDTVLAPDVGFVAKNRLPADFSTLVGFFPGAPDLAAEVISPSETYEQVETKVARYLDAGTRLVWVVRPKQKRVEVHRTDGTSALLSVGETLDGESVVSGFRLVVGR